MKGKRKWQEAEKEHYLASQRLPRYILQTSELESGDLNAKVEAWMMMVYGLLGSYTAQLCIHPEDRSRAGR